MINPKVLDRELLWILKLDYGNNLVYTLKLFAENDIEHWHSSTKVSDVTYLALYGVGQPTTWTEVLKQEYYDNVAERFISRK